MSPVWINSENMRAITKQLTLEELGVFWTLVMQYWVHGGWLPADNDEALFALLGPNVTRSEWIQTRGAIVPLLSRISEFSTDQDMTFGSH